MIKKTKTKTHKRCDTFVLLNVFALNKKITRNEKF